jgi:hypothetical protein
LKLKFTGKWLAGSAPKADQIGSPEVLAQFQEEWVCADGFESAVEWYGDGAEVARGLPAAAVRWVEHEDLIALSGHAQAHQRHL